MPTGRPPTWLLDPGQPGPVALEARKLGTRERLTIPARLLEGLQWITSSEPVECLLVLEEPGRILFHRWIGAGDNVLARRTALMAALQSDPEAEEQLLALEARYLRGTIETGGRILLPLIALVHLLGDNVGDRNVFVVRRANHLELWSLNYRNRLLRQRPDLLRDLP